MELHFNVTGERRKALVQAISEITGKPVVYASGAGRSYAIGELMVDKDGALDYSRHDGFIHSIVTALAEQGFSVTELRTKSTSEQPFQERLL